MRLPPDQVERFYKIWKPLILFVNQKLRVEASMLEVGLDDPWDYRKVYTIREALWANDPVREAFIAENPARLPPADLAIVESWRYRVAGTFTVYRHLKKYSLLIEDGSRQVYGVLGLASSLEEILPFTPCVARAVLLPFEGRIIYDSLIVPYNVHLGPGIRRNLQEIARDARERDAIITSLPAGQRASPEAEQGKARDVNARVLETFRKHLDRTGLSRKVVDRDVDAVSAFAERLAGLPEPRSLRDFNEREVTEHLTGLSSAGLKEAQQKQRKTALTRFVRFLRDTGRMDYDTAGYVLEVLKGWGR